MQAQNTLHKRFSTRVASANLAYVARITFSVSFVLPASKSAKKLLEVRNRMSILYVYEFISTGEDRELKPLENMSTWV